MCVGYCSSIFWICGIQQVLELTRRGSRDAESSKRLAQGSGWQFLVRIGKEGERLFDFGLGGCADVVLFGQGGLARLLVLGCCGRSSCAAFRRLFVWQSELGKRMGGWDCISAPYWNFPRSPPHEDDETGWGMVGRGQGSVRLITKRRQSCEMRYRVCLWSVGSEFEEEIRLKECFARDLSTFQMLTLDVRGRTWSTPHRQPRRPSAAIA